MPGVSQNGMAMIHIASGNINSHLKNESKGVGMKFCHHLGLKIDFLCIFSVTNEQD